MKNSIIRTLLLTIFLTGFITNICRAEPFTLSGSDVIQFPSKATGIEHKLVVLLPPSYQENKKQTYPVLYFLDAYWDAPLMSATFGNLLFDRVIPEFIMVGLALNEKVDIESYRQQYFSPTKKASNPKAGKFKQTLTMLTDEVIPYIESTYRAQSDAKARALAGQSMGGLFTLNALFEKPATFSRFIAVNPAVAWDINYMQGLLKANKTLPALNAVRTFISYGSEEYAPFSDPIKSFSKSLKNTRYSNLALQVHELEGMRHTGGKGEAYANGMKWVFADLKPEGPSGLERAIKGN